MVTFFAKPTDFRSWLEQHATVTSELIVGFHKKDWGKPSITWPEAVDEALCVGWIDGVRKRIDGHRYQIRFTPRKPNSTWSAVNIERVKMLTSKGRMRSAGLEAFGRRTDAKSRTYSYEQKASASFEPAAEARFRKQRAAWSFFDAQAPSYRKKVIQWVVSAKQESTREKRLAQLIKASQKGQRL